jgi:hypothetical protein
MKETLTHEQLEQLLPAAALEILEGDELLGVSAHVQQCANCERLLEAYREALATIATTLPEQPFQLARSDKVRANLLGRTRRGLTPPSDTGTRPRRASGWIDRWAGWAVAAAMAGVLLVHHSVHRPVAYGWLVAGVLMLVLLGLGVYVRIQRARLRALQDRDRTIRGAGHKP